jgi:hypothetical protein
MESDQGVFVLHNCITHSFLSFSLGRFCAGNPLVTLVVMSVITAGLSSGVAQLRVTDNPLELWSSKDSREGFDYFEQLYVQAGHEQSILNLSCVAVLTFSLWLALCTGRRQN